VFRASWALCRKWMFSVRKRWYVSACIIFLWYKLEAYFDKSWRAIPLNSATLLRECDCVRCLILLLLLFNAYSSSSLMHSILLILLHMMPPPPPPCVVSLLLLSLAVLPAYLREHGQATGTLESRSPMQARSDTSGTQTQAVHRHKRYTDCQTSVP